jgi:hypothetical protein
MSVTAGKLWAFCGHGPALRPVTASDGVASVVQFCSGLVNLVVGVCDRHHGGGRHFRTCPSTVPVVLTASP